MAKTPKSVKKPHPQEVYRLWKTIIDIKDPVEKEAIKTYISVLIAKQEGRLTQEQEEYLGRVDELIRCYRQLYCANPKPSPEQALILENRIKELSLSEQTQAEGGAA